MGKEDAVLTPAEKIGIEFSHAVGRVVEREAERLRPQHLKERDYRKILLACLVAEVATTALAYICEERGEDLEFSLLGPGRDVIAQIEEAIATVVNASLDRPMEDTKSGRDN
jgi:hypothetical protein